MATINLTDYPKIQPHYFDRVKLAMDIADQEVASLSTKASGSVEVRVGDITIKMEFTSGA